MAILSLGSGKAKRVHSIWDLIDSAYWCSGRYYMTVSSQNDFLEKVERAEESMFGPEMNREYQEFASKALDILTSQYHGVPGAWAAGREVVA